MVGGLYTAAAGVLIVAIVAIAYGAQAPALSVAEFSPSAQAVLESPPSTGKGEESRAQRGTRASTSTVTTTSTTSSLAASEASAAAPTTRVGRARRCFGDPPRQIEDPMSPSCLPYIFEGDNGGVTSTGVSATEIRVGIPGMSPSTTSDYNRTVDTLFEFFNRTFELYGRRLVPVYVGGSASDATSSRALGSQVAAQGVFGALNGYAEWGMYLQASLSHELARQKVVTIMRGASFWWSDRNMYDPLHPYVWSVYPSAEDSLANLGELACKGLAGAGRTAAQAGDASLRSKPRRFGILSYGRQVPPSADLLSEALANCSGAEPEHFEVASISDDGTAVRTGLNQFKSKDVTTVFCICETILTLNAIDYGHNIGFHPEWVFTPTQQSSGNDEHWVQGRRATQQLGAPLRLSAGPRLLPYQSRPWFAAIQAVNPGLITPSSMSTVQAMAEFFYDELLVLASGIQGAGPQLNPQTFAAGLMSTEFPNAGAGQPPYWQPSAGFGPGDHSLYDDYAVAWWSDDAPALDPISTSPRGSWCYLHQGARFRPGTYPADTADSLFNPAVPCR